MKGIKFFFMLALLGFGTPMIAGCEAEEPFEEPGLEEPFEEQPTEDLGDGIGDPGY